MGPKVPPSDFDPLVWGRWQEPPVECTADLVAGYPCVGGTVFSNGALSPAGVRITEGAGHKRQITGSPVRPMGLAPGDLCLCKLPRGF